MQYWCHHRGCKNKITDTVIYSVTYLLRSRISRSTAVGLTKSWSQRVNDEAVIIITRMTKTLNVGTCEVS